MICENCNGDGRLPGSYTTCDKCKGKGEIIDVFKDIAKLIVNNKYKLSLSKVDKAVYVVDIPKVIELLKEKYIIIEK